MSTESREDRELREFFSRVMRAIQEDESGVQMTNPKRMREFMLCADVMKKLFQKSGTKIEVIPHNMFPSLGTISVTTKNMVIRDPVVFADAAGLADNYEIYPKTDGTVVLEIAFYGLTRKG